MKVLIAHNHYQMSGGEDIVVNSEYKLLLGRGHQVELYAVSNDIVDGTYAKVLTAINSKYSKKTRIEFTDRLKRFRPDVVHVHNFFPLLTPSIYDACRAFNIPVIQTLHNYRLLCCGAMLLRNGSICTKCIDDSLLYGIYHRCYRRSFLGSLFLTRMIRYHNKCRTWNSKVDYFIALTEFSRRIFIDAGFPHDKVVVKPNFSNSEPYKDYTSNRSGAIFVGRLSEEKGIENLMEAWSEITLPLKIVGDGPLRNKLQAVAPKNVVFMGKMDSEQVLREMQSAEFLIVPSVWYEGFPMVIVEAFSAGLPVLASRLGGMAEIVKDGVTGLHFNSNDIIDLRAKIEWAFANNSSMKEMGARAYQTFCEKYTADENYKHLIGIYSKAIYGYKLHYEKK
ncbi:glycosyltransferase [Geobacter benzoatilyticus]|uniref:Glycosyltransferase n=1 Tax=Geobacter benzoatilyticus TaxID=2815309 RepID=A0ABX7Q0E4_9BACT|nr:glycosyltransferase [Geobacter benzoatilyticus]QSV44857.1 glycosyltransferase [Geobacter benzoatilyticus]